MIADFNYFAFTVSLWLQGDKQMRLKLGNLNASELENGIKLTIDD